MDSILDILKDDKEYYSGIGRNYLSNSDISTLLTNPKDFGKAREDNKALAEGRYFHQLLIEKQKALDVPHVNVSTRNTKEYKNYCEANNLQFAMLTKEKEDVEAIVSIMRSNIQFYDDIYAEGNKYEVPGITEIGGVMWKGKTDIECVDSLIDLKTTSDILKFRWSADSYNYDSQAFIYEAIFGKRMKFYVIDKVTGVLGIFTASDSFLKRGEEKVKRAIEVYNTYFGGSPTGNINDYFIQATL